MDDTEQMVVNELRRIDRAIDRREKALQAAGNKEGMRTFPKRYVLDLPVDVPYLGEGVIYVPGSEMLSVTRSFVVDRDCKRFFCRQLVASLIVKGSVQLAVPAPVPPPVSGTLTPPFSYDPLFSFLWKVRDTSTDRDWSDYPLPSTLLPIRSMIGAYTLPAPAVVDPGTEIEVSLQPLSAMRQSMDNTVIDISRVSVVFSFIGFEVL